MSGMLTVVVPVYNVEKYLDRCVLSIISQTYENMEIILVDDGSKDKSGMICDGWMEKDSRIRVIHKANGGLADARNAGIDLSRGEYIAFVDGDDSIDRNMYEVMIDEMETSKAKIACCGKRKLYPSGKEVLTQNNSEKIVLSTSGAIGKLLSGVIIDESVCDKVFKRVLFDGIRFPKGVINEDLPVMPYLFAKSERVVHVGEAFYNYHQNEGSITRSGYSAKMHVYIDHLHDVKSYIRKEFPELEMSLCLLIARYSCSMLYRLNSEPKDMKTYFSDYQWYKEKFNRTYHIYIKEDGLSQKDKFLAFCMHVGLGRAVALLNRIRKTI